MENDNSIVLITEQKKMEKFNALAPIFDELRQTKKELRINDFWDNTETRNELRLSDIWKTRAYFLQDFKRFIPDDIEVSMAQRKGTFAKIK